MIKVKTATTVEEQIAKLRERGVIIEDEEKAKEILLDIGYYRLGFYLFPFEIGYPNLHHRKHRYKEGTRFSDAVTLYYLDFDLRHILIRYLTRIEIALRTAIIYHISNKYKESPTWFVDRNVMREEYVKNFENDVYGLISKKDVIARHHKKYINDKFAPAWKTIEYMSLGEVCVLYQNLKYVDDKLLISRYFDIWNTAIFENYLETVRVIRNLCAHGNVLFDMKLRKGVKKGPIPFLPTENRYNLWAAIEVVAYFLRCVSQAREEEMCNRIDSVIGDAEKKFHDVRKLFWE